MPFLYHHPWDLDAQRDFDLRPLPVSGSPYAEPACPLNCLFARTAPLIPTPAHSVHTTYSNLPGDATTDLVSRAAQCLREKGKTSIQFESDPSLVSQLVDRLLHQINLPNCRKDDNRPFMAEWLLNDMFAQRISAEELLNEGNLAHYFLFTYCARANLFARKSVLWKEPDLCRGKWRLAPQDGRVPSGIAAYVTRGERLQTRAVLEIKRRREVPNWVLETLAWLAEQPGGFQLILEEDESLVPKLRLSIPSEEGLADRVMRAWEEDADGKVHTHSNEAVITFKFTTVKILSQIYLRAVSNLAENLLLFNDSDCMLFRCDDPRDPQRFSLSPDIPPLGISHGRIQPTFTTLLVALIGTTDNGAQKRPGDILRGEQQATKRQRTESRDTGPSADHDSKENVDGTTSRALAFTFDDRILTPFPLSAPQPTHADEGGVTVGNSGRNLHILDSSADLAKLPPDNVAFVPTHDMGRGAIGRAYGGLLYLPSSADSADAIAEANLAGGTHDNGHGSSKQRSLVHLQCASSLPPSLPTLNAPRSSEETSAIEESNVAPASRLGTSTRNDTAILVSTSSTNSDRSVACAPVRAVLKVTDLLTYLNGDEFALDLACHGLQLDDPRPPSRDEARQLVLNEANIYRSVFTGSRTAATIVPAYYGMWATGPAGCEVLVQVMDELGPAIGDSWQTLDWRWRPVIEHAYRQLHSLGVVHGDLEPRHFRLRSNDNGIPPDADASSLSPSTPDSEPSLAGPSSDLSDSPNDRLDGRHPSISPSRLVLIDFDHAKVASQEEIDAEWAELQIMCNYYLKDPRQ
ncbi:hypothetical protein K525DRAFT_265066 [Schizophyllum commune Loenen D]|nr:hypothetical protein K525DRAFT_265066 [Schizophyllum commune Loenen D]